MFGCNPQIDEADVNIEPGQGVKSSGVLGHVTLTEVTDVAAALAGIAISRACAGQPVEWVPRLNLDRIPVRMDGEDALDADGDISISTTTDGDFEATSDAVVAKARTAAPATAGVLVDAFFAAGGGGSSSSGYPNPTTTPDAVDTGAIDIDGSVLNTLHLVDLDDDATLAIATPVPGEVYQFVVTNAGAFDITWPGTVKWPAGGAPVMTPSGVDLVVLSYDGTSYFGTYAQAFA